MPNRQYLTLEVILIHNEASRSELWYMTCCSALCMMKGHFFLACIKGCCDVWLNDQRRQRYEFSKKIVRLWVAKSLRGFRCVGFGGCRNVKTHTLKNSVRKLRNRHRNIRSRATGIPKIAGQKIMKTISASRIKAKCLQLGTETG